MVDRAGAPAASGPVIICVGGFIILSSCAAAVLFSIISDFMPNRSGEVYGTEHTCSAVMLKFLYGNTTSKYSNSPVRNSTVLSAACDRQYESLGVVNYAGCLFINGRVWDAANNSATARRRRRQTTPLSAGLYYIGTCLVYRLRRCARGQGDLNSVVSTAKVSPCGRNALKESNKLFGGAYGTAFSPWTSSSRTPVEVTDMSGTTNLIAIDKIIGIPGNLAAGYATSSILPGADGYQSALILGCRHTRILTQAQIRAILKSQVNTASTDSSTASTG